MRSYYGYHRNIHTKNIRNYKKQLFVSKMDNIEGIDKFLERYNLLRLNQKEIENMNRSITRNEMKTVIKNLPTNKSPGPDGFTGKFYQTFREELTPVLKLFQRIAEGGTLSNSYEATITLTPKPDKDITKKISGQCHWWKEMQKSSWKY